MKRGWYKFLDRVTWVTRCHMMLCGDINAIPWSFLRVPILQICSSMWMGDEFRDWTVARRNAKHCSLNSYEGQYYPEGNNLIISQWYICVRCVHDDE